MGLTMKLKTLLLGLAMAGAFTSASALSVANGNNPQPGDSNLVRDPCGLVGGDTGSPVTGCLNDNHAQLVNITSDESLTITGGQASLDSSDGTFSQASISLVGASLTSVILNIDATAAGFVTFTDGAGTSSPFALGANGENFFTVTGITGGFLSFTTFDSNMVESDIVADVKQIRLGGGDVTAVPEPETYALMMAGLAALGFLSRRRRAQR
jgi:hypothetical protein